MLQSFYNNLFAVEITILGIVTAAVLVSLQILYTNYSYSQLAPLFKNPRILLYLILSPSVIIITGLAGFLLSLDSHNFFPKTDYSSNAFLSNQYFSLVLLIIFFLTLWLGFLIIWRSVRMLNPSTLVSEYKKGLTTKNIRRFLYRKYGVPQPVSLDLSGFNEPLLPKWANIESDKLSPFPKEDMALTEEEAKEIKEKSEQATKDLERAQEEYKKIEKEVRGAPNVFEGLSLILLKAVPNADVQTVKSGCIAILAATKSFLKDQKKGGKESWNKWEPESDLPKYFSQFIAEMLRDLLEACERHKVSSLATYFVRMSKEVALVLLDRDRGDAAKNILVEWKSFADGAIETQNRSLFNTIISSYSDLADVILEKAKKEGKDREVSTEDIFRHLGWLAERLLAKKKIEQRPLMHDDEYSNEYDTLLEVILKYGYKYRYDFPNWYPLIYFDAISVLFDKLLEVYESREVTDQQRIELENRLFDCVHIYSSFGSAAIEVENVDGVALAVINLKRAHTEIMKYHSQKPLEHVLGLMVSLAIDAGSSPEKLKKENMLHRPITEDLEEILVNSSQRGTIVKEVFEEFLKADKGNHANKWSYIKSLGVKMRSNFGFAFDEITGVDYTLDDPRRK